MAVWRESGPEMIGRGGSVVELVALARARGEDCRAGVVAVPAWYSDVQRRAVFEQAKAAGISTVQLMNEPTAATLAYGAAQAALPETCMVLNITSTRAFDVTLIAMKEKGVEVLATNGSLDVETRVPERFFATIEPVVNRALSDAGLRCGCVWVRLLVPYASVSDLQP